MPASPPGGGARARPARRPCGRLPRLLLQRDAEAILESDHQGQEAHRIELQVGDQIVAGARLGREAQLFAQHAPDLAQDLIHADEPRDIGELALPGGSQRPLSVRILAGEATRRQRRRRPADPGAVREGHEEHFAGDGT